MNTTDDESMWVSFRAECWFIVKVYAATVNAVSGEPWFESLDTKARRRRQIAAGESLQDYMLVEPGRRQVCSLDGMAVAPGVFRQFEARPSGQRGYSTEILMSRGSSVGDLQFEVTMEKNPLIRAPLSTRPRRWRQPQTAIEEKLSDGGTNCEGDSEVNQARASNGPGWLLRFARGNRDPPFVPPPINSVRFALLHDGADKPQDNSDSEQVRMESGGR